MSVARDEDARSRPVVVVSPNLALDHICVVSALSDTHGVFRAQQEIISAGGKGVNVCRAFRKLGIPSCVIGFSAGKVGNLIESLARTEGIDISPVAVRGESRIASILVGGDPPRSLVINPPGPRTAESEWRRLVRQVVEHIKECRPDAVICTGSLPPGIPPDGYNDILLAGQTFSAMTVIDASDEVLHATLETAPSLAKVNLDEALSVLRPTPPIDVPMAAESLRKAGAVVAIVTAGRQGACAATSNEVLFGEVPPSFPGGPLGRATHSSPASSRRVCRATYWPMPSRMRWPRHRRP